MEKGEIVERFNRCKEKADIYGWSITDDPDEMAEIELDEDGHLYLCGVKTMFTNNDVVKIKFHKNDYDPSFIRVTFDSGESIDFNEEGDVEAYLRKNNILLYNYGVLSLQRLKEIYEEHEKGIANEEFVVVNGILRAYNGGINKKLCIPEGVEVINPGVFEYEVFEQLILPKSVKQIGDYAFRFCKNLKEVSLNEGLEIIGDRSFCACEALKKIVIPCSVKTIKGFAFGSSGLEIVDGLKEEMEVAEDAFSYTPFKNDVDN